MSNIMSSSMWNKFNSTKPVREGFGGSYSRVMSAWSQGASVGPGNLAARAKYMALKPRPSPHRKPINPINEHYSNNNSYECLETNYGYAHVSNTWCRKSLFSLS